jgi:hypothetical protein
MAGDNVDYTVSIVPLETLRFDFPLSAWQATGCS